MITNTLGRSIIIKLSTSPTRLLSHAAAALAASSFLSACATGPYTYNEGSTTVARYTTKAPDPSDALGLYIELPGTGGASSIIKKGQAFSVHLSSAYICDFSESSSLSDSLGKGNIGASRCEGGGNDQHARTRGEIAIIGSVGERSGSGGLTFDPSKINNGRVIYYNEDMRETGQLINANNLPVYGPKTYDGNPFYMDWSVLELDNKENAAARKLLQQLADLGSLPAAPYTPILKLLNTLGGALLDANSDDLEMRYQMETDSALDCGDGKAGTVICGELTVRRMPLREGYYAFIRSENRSEDTDLRQLNLKICPENGLLCDSNGKTWRGKTWMLIRIAREGKDAALAQDAAQTLSGLMSSLNENGTSITKSTLTDFSNNVKNVLDSLSSKHAKEANQ